MNNYNPTLYHKTVVCDFDDTIAITTTRDWDNAEPIFPVINRINKLYDMGWQILIVTARGQLSCNGDFEKADKKYRSIIESWLKKHGVKYHTLSFHKHLASYYIDDKALTPEEFVDLEIKEIKTGWSGAKVEKRGDRIFKTHHDSIQAACWYKMAAPLVNVPIVYSMIGETLCLEFIESNGHYFKLDEINAAIDKFALYKTPKNFYTYTSRIDSHIEYNNMFHSIRPFLEDTDFIVYCNNRSSFMHGDLSLENMIQTDKGLFFIDPIYNEGQWSSYLLDVSKLLHSYRKYNRMFEYEVFLNGWVKRGENEKYLKILEVTQWIRICKYAPSDQRDELANITNKLINELI